MTVQAGLCRAWSEDRFSHSAALCCVIVLKLKKVVVYIKIKALKFEENGSLHKNKSINKLLDSKTNKMVC